MISHYNVFKEVPLVKLLPFVLLGCFLGILFPSSPLSILSYILSVLLLLYILILRSKLQTKKLRQQILHISAIYPLLCSLLFYNIAYSSNLKAPNHYTPLLNYQEKSTIKLCLESVEHLSSGYIKSEAKIICQYTKDTSYSVSGKIMLYIKKDSLGEVPRTGQHLLASLKLMELPPPHNPYEFNYKSFLEYQQIYATAFIGSNDWYLLDERTTSLKLFIYSVQERCSKVLNTYIKGKQEKAIANALLLGKKDQLDSEILNAYASSGAMHILAVSGMHIGIVYLLFNYLLSLLKFPKSKLISPFILILLIWFYAFLTGASPSVLRAATMFSFIVVGKLFKHHVNSYNMIAASAILLIVLNPNIVMKVGFQLSYCAVIGIIALYPYMNGLYKGGNLFIQKIWSLCSVSIVAQIATLPFSLYYFHQFANLFLLANLVVIPAAILIIYLGIPLLIFAKIPLIATKIGLLLHWIISMLNTIISYIENISFSVTKNINISIQECILLYIILILLVLGFQFKLKPFIKGAALSLFFFVGLRNYKLLKHSNDTYLTVYAIPNKSLWEIRSGQDVYLYGSESSEIALSTINYKIKPNWIANNIKEQHKDINPAKNEFISISNKTIFCIDSFLYLKPTHLSPDYVIIQNMKYLDLVKINSILQAKRYIFDTSNNQYQLAHWKSECESLLLDCYFVAFEGAFEEKLN